MSRTIDRSEKMMQSIVLRATPADKQKLKEYAQSKGTNCSNLIRMMLIEAGIINAM